MNLSALPKVELHCHLEGTVDAAMVSRIREHDPHFPIPPEAIRDYKVHDYASFWGWWERLAPFRQPRNLPFYKPVIAEYIADLKRQNVRYFELMISSGDVPKDTQEALDTVSAFRAWVDELEGGAIQVEFLIACGRQNTAESMAARADRMIALHEAGLICGIVLGGPEPDNPVSRFASTFAKWHEAGLGIEIHAGEWVGAESVWDGLEHGFLDRIGHGVTLFDDPRLIEIFQERQIHIEMCPTSNLKTGSISDIDQHPICKARDLGLNFSVNTDDPGPFECSMNSEYELLADRFGFTEDDFMTIYHNSLAARFQPELRIDV